MSKSKFGDACNNLSELIDPAGYDERRWQSDEGQKLNDSVAIARSLFSENGEFDVSDARSLTRDTKVLTLTHKALDRKVANLHFKVGQDHLMVWTAANQDNGFQTHPMKQLSIPIQEVTETTLQDVLTQAVGQICVVSSG